MYTNIQIHSFTHTHNEYSLEELMLKLKLKLRYFGHLMWRADSLEKTLMLGKVEGRRRRGQEKMRWFDGITNTVDLSEQTLGDSGQGSLVCCSPWGCKESDTLLSNWTTMTATHIHTHRHTHTHTHWETGSGEERSVSHCSSLESQTWPVWGGGNKNFILHGRLKFQYWTHFWQLKDERVC